MGSKKPPKPSAQETALLQQKQALITQQQGLLAKAQTQIDAAEEARKGLLAQSQAYINRPPSEAEIRANETQRLYDERLQRALRGDIPVDPIMERGIEQDRSAVETSLARALGPNYMASTPGQEAMNRFNESVAGQRFNARQAYIAGTEAPSFSRYSLGQNLATQGFERPLTLSGAYGGLGQGYLGASQGYGQIEPGINNQLGFYTNERMLPFTTAEQRRAQTLQGLGQLAGAGANFYTQGFALPGAIKNSGDVYKNRFLGNPSPYPTGYNPSRYSLGVPRYASYN